MDETTRLSVEALLLSHPEIAKVSVVFEEAADGRDYSVAYAVVQPGCLSETSARKCQTTESETRVSQWKKSFDLAYRPTIRDPRPSFAGWKSSYTNKPIPEQEMQEWLDATTARILSLHPRNVIEVGCGVGLLVEAVAPKCMSYRGYDVSPIAVASLQTYVSSKSELHHVALSEGEAADLCDEPAGSADTVIINSVIQYFPDIDYLRYVIGEAVRVVGDKGRIFIGDVRHFGLLPLFHSAVQLAKAPSDATARWLRRRVDLAVEQERELAVSPEFFLDLHDTFPQLSHVEVLLRRGTAHNELTRYRYDVILHVGGHPLPLPAAELEWQAQEDPIKYLRNQIEEGSLGSLIIKNIPNKRLSKDIAALQQLSLEDDGQLAEAIRVELNEKPEVGIDPEDFSTLAQKGGFDVRVSPSSCATEGQYDVMIAGHQGETGTSAGLHKKWAVTERLATDPLSAAYKQRLGSHLHDMLRAELAEEVLPAAVIVVEALPRGV
jgi:SAM-dependent methyltransferase